MYRSKKDLVTVKEYIRFGFPSKIDEKFTKFKNHASELSIVKGCIMYGNRVYIPETLRHKIIDLFHDGHPGISAMKSTARSLIWYPKMDSEIEFLVKNCKRCTSNYSKPSQRHCIEWPKPERSWSRLHIDHFFFE